VVAAGVVVPGVVDRAAGVASYAANIGWTDVPLRDVLEVDLGIPVAVDHDVHAAGEAERALGAATACDDFAVVVIGTGIAAITYSEGRMVRGATKQAGEIGHVPVVPDGEPCACGARGCLETYASAAAITRRYARRTGRPVLTAAQIVARRVTDPAAASVWTDATRCLGDALASLTLFADPELIVLAGGLSEAGEALLVPVRERVQACLAWRSSPSIVTSPLGARAGRVGAAVIAWRRIGLADDLAWDPRVRNAP
jgi:glucokinase